MRKQRIKTKIGISISLDRKIYDVMNIKFENNSKYIEWLVYQDLLKNFDNDEIKKILI